MTYNFGENMRHDLVNMSIMVLQLVVSGVFAYRHVSFSKNESNH